MRDKTFASVVVRSLQKKDVSPWSILQAGVSVQMGTGAITANELLSLLGRQMTKFSPRGRSAALLTGMVLVDTSDDAKTSQKFLAMVGKMAMSAFHDFVESRHLSKNNEMGRLFAGSDFVDASVLRNIDVVVGKGRVTLDLRGAFAMTINLLRGEALIEEWSDVTKAAQVESLRRLRVTLRESSRTITAKEARGCRNLADIVGKRIDLFQAAARRADAPSGAGEDSMSVSSILDAWEQASTRRQR
jgi:hypothetical protein